MGDALSAASAVAAKPRLTCAGLSVEAPGRTLVRGLDLEIFGGALTCVLGCNGAGKTLTLHTLAGLREPAAGNVKLDALALDKWPRRELARRIGLLTQTTEDPFPSTVLDSVLVGRHPHIDFWRWESDADRAIARAALPHSKRR